MKNHIVYIIFISLFPNFDFYFPVQCKDQTKTVAVAVVVLLFNVEKF